MIHARVWVEAESQKGILIGSGGTMIKKHRNRGAPELERELGTRVHLELDGARAPRLARRRPHAGPPRDRVVRYGRCAARRRASAAISPGPTPPAPRYGSVTIGALAPLPQPSQLAGLEPRALAPARQRPCDRDRQHAVESLALRGGQRIADHRVGDDRHGRPAEALAQHHLELERLVDRRLLERRDRDDRARARRRRASRRRRGPATRRARRVRSRRTSRGAPAARARGPTRARRARRSGNGSAPRVQRRSDDSSQALVIVTSSRGARGGGRERREGARAERRARRARAGGRSAPAHSASARSGSAVEAHSPGATASSVPGGPAAG